MSTPLSRRVSLFAMAGLAVAQQPSPSDLNRVKVGDLAPAFDLPSAAGGNLTLQQLRGKNAVLVFYRGYW